MAEKVLHKGSCHCAAIKFSILHSPTHECNCSICSMKGFPPFPPPSPSLTSLSGQENLSEYKFNTGTAKHWFCKPCGISPLTVPRSYPEGYNINFRCLQRDNVKSFTVTKRDGQHWEESIKASNQGKVES